MKKIENYIKKNYKWIVLLLMSIVFIMFAIRIKNNPGLKIDDDVYNYIHRFTSDNLTSYFKMISSFISGPVIAFILLISITICYYKKNYKYIPFIIGNIIIILVLNLVLKQIYTRPRPSFMLIDEYGYSFPSGHSSSSFAVGYTMLRKGNKKIGIPAIILAILIAFSRLYVAVHFPSDVVTGIIIGIIFSYVGEYSLKLIEKKNSSENKE